MNPIDRREVIMPGGIEMTLEAERHVDIRAHAEWLSVACGSGELELYLAQKHGCAITGIDIGEWAITRSREKTVSRGLANLARFEVGDGSALQFAAGTFDGLYCSGALCAFYNQGLQEFYRVLKPAGKAVILDVIWWHEPVPEEIVQRWAGREAEILTLGGNARAFEERGFRVLLAKGYHEAAWWEAYYRDRGDALHWRQERDNYRIDWDYLGVGLFILEKT